MTRRKLGIRAHGRGYCFLCGAYSVGVLDSRPGDAAWPWTRRRRECRACGERWFTVEVVAPTDPLAPAWRAGPAVPEDFALLSPPESAPLAWREVVTCR